jgi:hypothetical protein
MTAHSTGHRPSPNHLKLMAKALSGSIKEAKSLKRVIDGQCMELGPLSAVGLK